MTTNEPGCYTLINVPSDSEPPTEMQLKMDLGNKILKIISLVS